MYALGDMFVKGLLFITLPIYTRSLLAVGLWFAQRYSCAMVSLIMAVLILGGDSAYARFFFSARITGRNNGSSRPSGLAFSVRLA